MYKSFQVVESTGFGVSKQMEAAASVDELKERLEACVKILMYWVVYTFFTLGAPARGRRPSPTARSPPLRPVSQPASV
eukprot:SAG22_NODE_14248_length_380_cov_0.985765_1_plen_78_part_01